jgi:hypothetical protein
MEKYGGFDRRLHKRFVRGRIKLPAIFEPDWQPSMLMRLKSRLGLYRAAA